MDQEGILLSVVSQTEKDKYGIISFTCEVQKKKKDTFKKTETELYIQRTNR